MTMANHNDNGASSMTKDASSLVSAEESERIKHMTEAAQLIGPFAVELLKKNIARMINVLEAGGLLKSLGMKAISRLGLEMTVKLAISVGVRSALMGILLVLGPMATIVDAALFIFSAIGMIYDHYDPHHYNNTLFRENIVMIQKHVIEQSFYGEFKSALERIDRGEMTGIFQYPIAVNGLNIYNSIEWFLDQQNVLFKNIHIPDEIIRNMTINSRGEVLDDAAIFTDEENDISKRPAEWNKLIQDCSQSIAPINTRIHQTIACLEAKVQRENTISAIWWTCLIAGTAAAGVIVSRGNKTNSS
uniref:U22-like protein n=1 Tax=Glypta fumiferanae TaxID=389681 RepID=A0A0F6Q8C2_9HYME|nr:U22-like protein [Glypta fumiferanae]